MLVVGANLTIDRTLSLTRLIPGSVQRPHRAVASPGGKSVNVCRAARAAGVRPRLIANLPGRLGQFAGDLLDDEGHDVVRVRTSGEIRSAIIILEADLRTTVLNEPGPALTAADRGALLDAIRVAAADEATGDRVLVASGSLPPGSDSLYADIVRVAHDAGLRVILDAARHDLAMALPAEPDIVTPNLAEALAVLGGADGAAADESVEPAIDGARETALGAAAALTQRGAGAALVTVGRHGVAGASGAQTFWFDAPTVTEVNPIGAGDSFAAGLACGLATGDHLIDATRRAVATGAASVASEVAGQVDPTLLAELLQTMAVAPIGGRQ